jgi:Mg-chelatase subunit ChlD
MDTKNQKTNIYKVVILVRSGSMDTIKQEAINGYNETLAAINIAQAKYADTQAHFVTLVTFDSELTDTVYDRVPCSEAAKLTEKTYQPGAMTPLYDAMGMTLSKFRTSLDDAADNKVLVTIITDGQENASKEFSGKQIHKLVAELKEKGWVFAYIGANQDVDEVARTINITNVMSFEATGKGTTRMFKKASRSSMNFFDRVAENASQEELQEGFFDADE